jgi:hypothetical protein
VTKGGSSGRGCTVSFSATIAYRGHNLVLVPDKGERPVADSRARREEFRQSVGNLRPDKAQVIDTRQSLSTAYLLAGAFVARNGVDWSSTP